jgi:hypothetical protein
MQPNTACVVPADGQIIRLKVSQQQVPIVGPTHLGVQPKWAQGAGRRRGPRQVRDRHLVEGVGQRQQRGERERHRDQLPPMCQDEGAPARVGQPVREQKVGVVRDQRQ